MQQHTDKPVVLLVVANPTGNLTHLGQEFDQVREHLESTGLNIQQRPYASLDILLKALQDYRDQMAVFYYGGHATELGLLMETGSGGALALAGGLAKFLSTQQSLKLVFLNGCSTEKQIKEFHAAGVPVVIGTKRQIPDEGAARVAGWFYRALSTGANLAQAFAEAKAALEAVPEGQTRDYVPSSKTSEAFKPSDLWMLSAKREEAKEWSFADALGDPLFGLPPLPERDLPPKPYKHLSFFSEAEAELFFGRSREIRDLYFRVITPSTDPILLLYGQSGVGKSSLLDAGLTPRLRAKGYEVRYVRRDGGLGLKGTLCKALEATTEDVAGAWKALEARLGKPVVIILDQLEEAYSRKESDAKAGAELADVSQALQELFAERGKRPKGKLILSFRKEWLGEIKDALKPNQNYISELPLLKPLNQDGILQAIVGPTTSERLQHKYGLTIEPRLPEQMAHDLLDHNSPIAPTLQLTLTKMWDKVDQLANVRRFDTGLYQQLRQNDLGGILDSQLTELERLRPEEVKSGLALDLLQFHTTYLGTAAQKTEAETLNEYGQDRAQQIHDLVQATKNLYLISDLPGTDLKATRLSHDTLAPYVRERFEKSDKPGPRAKRILESRSVDWRPGKNGMPLDAADLGIVEKGIGGTRKLNETELRLVEASVKQRYRNKFISIVIVSALVVLTIFASIFGVLSDRRAKEAQRQRMVSIAQGMAVRAGALANDPSQFTLATLLATQAYRLHQKNGGRVLEQMDTPLRSLLSYQLLFSSQTLPMHQDTVNSVTFSLDGKRLASGSADRTIRLWDLSNPKAEPVVLKGHQDMVNSVAFSHNGKILASGGSDNTIRLWDLTNTNAQPVVLNGYQTRFNSGAIFAEGQSNFVLKSLALSPDGLWLASAWGFRNSQGDVLYSSIRLWGLKNLKAAPVVLKESEGFSSSGGGVFLSVAFSPDGQWLASGSDDSIIHLWDLKNLKAEPLALNEHNKGVLSITFSPDSKWLASGGNDTTIRLRYLKNPKSMPIEIDGLQGSVHSVAFSPDGQWLASGGEDSTVRLWNMKTLWKFERKDLRGHQSSVRSVSFSPDGLRLVSGSNDNTIRLWDLKNVRVEPVVLESRQNSVLSVAFSPDGGRLASGGWDKTIRLWSMKASLQNPMASSVVLKGHQDMVNSVAFSPNGQRLASGSADSTIRLWEFKNPGFESVVLEPFQFYIKGVAFSPDGQRLASGTHDSSIVLWNFKDAKVERLLLRTHMDWVNAVAFSPDGQYLASGSGDKTIHLSNPTNIKAEPRVLEGHQGSILSVAFSPDSKKLASGSFDNTIRLWDLKNPKAEPIVLRGHRFYVSTVAFSLEGQWLASGGFDRTIRIWDLKNPTAEPLALKGHSDTINSVVFNPDGKRLASGSNDKTIRLWRTTETLTTELACWVLVRNLSQDEWNHYIGPDIPYERTCPNLPPGEGAPAQAK